MSWGADATTPTMPHMIGQQAVRVDLPSRRLSNDIAEHMANLRHRKAIAQEAADYIQVHGASLRVPSASRPAEGMQDSLVTESHELSFDPETSVPEKEPHLRLVEFVLVEEPALASVAETRVPPKCRLPTG